jgi:cupin fold WbuC family metalloprotein
MLNLKTVSLLSVTNIKITQNITNELNILLQIVKKEGVNPLFINDNSLQELIIHANTLSKELSLKASQETFIPQTGKYQTRNRAGITVHKEVSGSANTSSINMMISLLKEKTFVGAHRHGGSEFFPDKTERFLLLKGNLGIVFFNKLGETLNTLSLNKEFPYLEIPTGTFHSVVCLSPEAMMIEIKDGPYNASTDKDWLNNYQKNFVLESYQEDGQLSVDAMNEMLRLKNLF